MVRHSHAVIPERGGAEVSRSLHSPFPRCKREPDVPAWAPLLYQLQLLDFRDKPDPLTLPVADRIRIGNQKRERGNFHFQREEYSLAARAYSMALSVLTTRSGDGGDDGVKVDEEEEVREYRVKCLNNLAAAQLKLEQYEEALGTSRDVLTLEQNNVKALFRTGKLLSDKGEYKEAMEVLKKALKLEPTTKAIHAELSKLVRRQLGGKDVQEWSSKQAEVLGDNIAPFLVPKKKKPALSDISDSDCKELRGGFSRRPEAGAPPCLNGTGFLRDFRIGIE
ncbi:Peptidyl-prolyl cis-trans isomerase FKBP8 [Takifugu flavidus]|uniref:Peptidyl-prolyl cis-trans isomerase FKBP8 n=1 Tax=Takifugu flavidus TaxID=433684 RepID=A0A5C6PA25_9TELE|nr:Peptidyl-prolyl cis-trans isomerase FKBP8 [Takifugu flavidus]